MQNKEYMHGDEGEVEGEEYVNMQDIQNKPTNNDLTKLFFLNKNF